MILQKAKIPATLVEAAVYLRRNVCMAYPPVLCVDAGNAFNFSGGNSTGPVYDFESGIAILRENEAIWTWQRRNAESLEGGAKAIGKNGCQQQNHAAGLPVPAKGFFARLAAC